MSCVILAETARGWKVRQTETFANPRKKPKITTQYYDRVWFDNQKGQWDAVNNRADILGIYAVKSPYHEETHYLPFIILSYSENDNTYEVMTVEYKGMTSYKVDTYYPENSVQELITDGIIIKKANPDNFKDNKEAHELIQQYSTANNPIT